MLAQHNTRIVRSLIPEFCIFHFEFYIKRGTKEEDKCWWPQKKAWSEVITAP